MQVGPQVHDQVVDDPVDAETKQPEEADGERQDAERSEQVLRPLVEAGEEVDGEQVEEALDDPRRPVLAPAELAWAVVDDYLSHFPAASGGQDWNEAVQVAVDADFPQDLTAVAL